MAMALRRRGLPAGSPPPIFAAIAISLENLLKIRARLASIPPLNLLTFDHLLCPAMSFREFCIVSELPDRPRSRTSETERPLFEAAN
jgi:hypothetical protein